MFGAEKSYCLVGWLIVWSIESQKFKKMKRSKVTSTDICVVTILQCMVITQYWLNSTVGNLNRPNSWKIMLRFVNISFVVCNLSFSTAILCD